MKGKPILYSISSPVEDMQVVYNNTITNIYDKDWSVKGNLAHIICGKTTEMGTPHELVKLSELNQIVIEYEPHPHAGISKKGTGPGVFNKFKETLPLHPSDWKYALEHINEEVEFEEVHDLSPDFTKSPIFVHGAKLILPSPVTYTEEEMFNGMRLAIKAVNEEKLEWDTFGNIDKQKKALKEWWNNNKKK